MAALAQLSKPVSKYRRISLWVVGAVLLLQLLAVLSTWQCSGPVHMASHGRPPFTTLRSWLSGHSMCDRQTGKAAFPSGGIFEREHSNSVRRQRPYAYAFCLTSVHHLCTALLNTVRLRKLQSFQVISNTLERSWPGCRQVMLHRVCAAMLTIAVKRRIPAALHHSCSSGKVQSAYDWVSKYWLAAC